MRWRLPRVIFIRMFAVSAWRFDCGKILQKECSTTESRRETHKYSKYSLAWLRKRAPTTRLIDRRERWFSRGRKWTEQRQSRKKREKAHIDIGNFVRKNLFPFLPSIVARISPNGFAIDYLEKVYLVERLLTREPRRRARTPSADGRLTSACFDRRWQRASRRAI